MTFTGTATPYGDAAWTYRRAGWQGVIPIGYGPRRKNPPYKGYTGWTGLTPSGADVQSWVDGRESRWNIGLHLPLGVIAVDVDAYHGGDRTLARLTEKVGHPLPVTWSSTARGQDSPSRQLFYRAYAPHGRVWADHPGGHRSGIDAIHRGHRYAAVWPSINPDADNAVYGWYDPDGEEYEGVPQLDWLTALDADWVMALTKDGTVIPGEAADDETTNAAVARFPVGPPCYPVAQALRRELARIEAAGRGEGGLHDPGRIFALTALAIVDGHAGVAAALSEHQLAYVAARVEHRGESQESAGQEWWRSVRGAVGKLLHQSGGLVPDTCACKQPDLPPPDPGEPPLTEEEQAEAARLLAVQQRAEKIRIKAEEERIRREARRLVDSEDMAALQATRRLRLVDGWEFLQEDPETEEQAIWGAGPQWMWAPGEPMMLFGGNGVYKSTLSHLLVFARLGLLGPGGTARTDHRVVTDEDHPDEWGRVLGMPVQPMAHGTTLIYLAGDRPRQIRRAMRRHRRDWMRDILAERLIIHEGPLPFELTTNKDGLADLAMERKGSDIFVDSLKDYCPKPSEDESANGYNRARQECIARGMQWVEDHHNRKIAQGQTRTNGIEDVYGSRWLTAGAGSVVSMWCDEEGSPAVHVKQVKSPGEFVPELEVTVDKAAGTMGAAVRQDPISFIRSAGAQGITANEYATFTGLAVNAARNQLSTRTKQGVLERVDSGAGAPVRWRVVLGVVPQVTGVTRQEDGLG